MSCGVGHRRGSDLVLLWLWCRPVATAPIQLTSLETSICHECSPKKTKRPKKKKKKKEKKTVNKTVPNGSPDVGYN